MGLAFNRPSRADSSCSQQERALVSRCAPSISRRASFSRSSDEVASRGFLRSGCARQLAHRTGSPAVAKPCRAHRRRDNRALQVLVKATFLR
jgi:hypothetical protein